MEWMFKLVIVLALLLLAIVFIKVARSGASARTGQGMVSHARYTNYAVWLTLLVVVLIEVAVRFGIWSQRGSLLTVHLMFAVPFLFTLLSLRFWITGHKQQYVHRIIAYACLSLFTGTLVTGVLLMMR